MLPCLHDRKKKQKGYQRKQNANLYERRRVILRDIVFISLQDGWYIFKQTLFGWLVDC
jgi:hypothetical protein